jgi:hypothetical protein
MAEATRPSRHAIVMITIGACSPRDQQKLRVPLVAPLRHAAMSELSPQLA